MIARRKFLTGLGCFLAAPAIIKVAGIMPIKAFDWHDRPVRTVLWDPLDTGSEGRLYVGDPVQKLYSDELSADDIRRIVHNAMKDNFVAAYKPDEVYISYIRPASWKAIRTA